MHSLREFLNERLTAAAEEIFDAVERTIVEYREEIIRSKDLEISRLRMQLKLFKSESESDECLEAEQLQPTDLYHPPSPSPSVQQQHHQSSPPMSAPEHSEEEEDKDSEPPECSQVKQEPQRAHRQFWMDHDGQHFEGVESDMNDLISSPTGLKTSPYDQALHFHPSLGNSSGDESRDKPYSCSVCEKRFNNCSHLAAHIRTHTGERPYKCEICSKTFITTSALNRHQTIHTEGKRFVCNYCGKSFKWMESLGRHLRSAHKKGDVSDSGGCRGDEIHTNVQ
ncbi:zinc finger protein 3 homolog [Melanotaenia boesemani]|uniref:zinc finger protein 3 homolog n=1 Tax=Melanotaenia boesemani TaxID=1250792 RepID=UPI001C053648|nr:zinc finger protein 3 homolog [Melanotaenia boesemani]